MKRGRGFQHESGEPAAGPDGHAAETDYLMGQLHTAAPKLEREQPGELAPTFLIKGGYAPIDGLLLPSYSTIRMLFTGGILALMKSTARLRFAHSSEPMASRCIRRAVRP